MIKKIVNKIILKLLNLPILGPIIVDYLVWKDSTDEKRYLTSTEAVQIVKQYSLLGEGVKEFKSKINSLVKSRDAEQYHKTLNEIEDLISLVSLPDNDPKVILTKSLRDIAVKKGNKDIQTPEEHLKMLQKRVEDMKELHKHKEKREVLRKIRQAKKDGNLELLKQLEEDWKSKCQN